MRSRAFSITSARDIGLRGVPRTAETRSERRVPSVRLDLDDRDAHRQQLGELFVAHEVHFRALAQDGRVLHARLVVRGVERDGLVEQHHGDHVLQADVGDVAVVHDSGHRWGEAHGHALHLIRLEGPLVANRFDRVEWPLDRRADGPFFDIGLHDLVALAELVDEALRLRLRSVGDGRNCLHLRRCRRRRSSPIARPARR